MMALVFHFYRLEGNRISNLYFGQWLCRCEYNVVVVLRGEYGSIHLEEAINELVIYLIRKDRIKAYRLPFMCSNTYTLVIITIIIRMLKAQSIPQREKSTFESFRNTNVVTWRKAAN